MSITPETRMSCNVLVIEDSDADYEGIMRATREEGISARFLRCRDGDAAVEFLFGPVNEGEERHDLMPSIIVIDLNLPGTSGDEVLQAIPVIVFTSSSNIDDVRCAYRHGANCYIVKPETMPYFKDIVTRMLRFWLDTSSLP